MSITKVQGLVPGCSSTWRLERGGYVGEHLRRLTSQEWYKECDAVAKRLHIPVERHHGMNHYRYYAWPVTFNPALSILADRAIVWIVKVQQWEYTGIAYCTLLHNDELRRDKSKTLIISNVDLANPIRVKMTADGKRPMDAADYMREFRKIGDQMWNEWLASTTAGIAGFLLAAGEPSDDDWAARKGGGWLGDSE
jgi:hypothetical protein